VDGCEECAVHDESAPGETQRNALLERGEGEGQAVIVHGG